MKIIALLLSIAVLHSACKCSDKSAKAAGATTAASPLPGLTAQQDSARKSEMTSSVLNARTHRLCVSFISIGEGTYAPALEMMDTYVSKKEKEFKKAEIFYASKAWGREGESDHYFLLNELSTEQQADFIAGMKAIFNGNQLILIEENRPNRFVK